MRVKRVAARLLPAAMAASMAVGVLATSAAPVMAAGDQLQETGVTTYELMPAKHLIHVTIVYKLLNKAPSKSRSYSCPVYEVTYYGVITIPRTCTVRTNYYYNAYNISHEKDAQHIMVKASSGTVTWKNGKVTGGWQAMKMKISPLWYGQSRTLTLTYDLPGGGPRSTTVRQAGYGYASFCGYGPGTDKGVLKFVAPSGYALSASSGMKKTVANGKETWTSAMISKAPWTFGGCPNGFNGDAWDTVTASTVPGLTVTVNAWKDDPTWAANVQAAAADLAKVQGILGDPVISTLNVRETRGPINVMVQPTPDGLHVSEYELNPQELGDALIAAAWLPSDTFNGWIAGGYTSWARKAAGLEEPRCDDPGTAPASMDLSRYTAASKNAGATDQAIWAWKQRAACAIVSGVAAAIGPEATLQTLAELRAGIDGWSSDASPLERTDKIVRWQAWLDIVTEHGLVPAGANPDLAANLLVKYGAASDADLVAAHAKARDDLHKLAGQTGGSVPDVVTLAMRDWDFPTAQKALDTAFAALETAGQAADALPGVEAANGKVATAVAAADTQDELDAAETLAETQLRLATDVADAKAVGAAPRDAFQELGLLGTEIPSLDSAVKAVSDVDEAGATGPANQLRSVIAGAHDAGVQRAAAIAIGSVVVLLVLAGLLALVLRRRARRSRRSATVPESGA